MKVCSFKKVGKLSLNNKDDNESDVTNKNECKKCDMYNLRYVRYELDISINNKFYSMELDSGVARSVISERFYRDNFRLYKLSKSDIVFCL